MPKIVYSFSSDRKIAHAFYVYVYICLYIAFWFYLCSVYLHVHNYARVWWSGRQGWVPLAGMSDIFTRIWAICRTNWQPRAASGTTFFGTQPNNKTINFDTRLFVKGGGFLPEIPNQKICLVKTYLNVSLKFGSSSFIKATMCINHVNVVQPPEFMTDYDYTWEKGTLFSTIRRIHGSPGALSS